VNEKKNSADGPMKQACDLIITKFLSVDETYGIDHITEICKIIMKAR
jgi:hypothetical protein